MCFFPFSISSVSLFTINLNTRFDLQVIAMHIVKLVVGGVMFRCLMLEQEKQSL